MRLYGRGVVSRGAPITTITVTGDLDVVYSVFALTVSADLTPAYSVLDLVQANLTPTYNVRVSVAANLTGTYTVAAATARADLVAVYSLETFSRYIEILPSDDVDLVFNKWVGTREGSEPLVWENLDSQTRYFLRSKQVGSLVASDSELLNQLQWKDGQFSEFLSRIDTITIQPLVDPNDTDYIEDGLAREVGDKITILETPPGFSTQKSSPYVIQNIRGEITTGPLNSLKLTFGLWPAVVSSFWVAGDSELSLAGVSTRPGY